MTQVGSPIAPRTDTVGLSYVEWGAVFAGAVLAAALSFVLLTFGVAIGLSATSPWPGSGLSAKVIASVAVFWTMAQQIGSVMAGGYVAGRMRSRWYESGHEAEFRDGLHGALVWGVAVLISALLIFATAGAVARTGASFAGKAAGSMANSTDATDTVIDAMLRPVNAGQAAPAGPQGTSAAQATPTGQRLAGTEETRAEIARILATSVAGGSMTSENRTYLTQLVAQRTGIPQQEAERRVNNAVNAARDAADKARHAAILVGFVTAAGLIISLGAGWWAAMRGGQHRDTSVPARFTFGDRRRRNPVA
jgi:hypothetical protein